MIQTLCLLEMADLARKTYPQRWWCLQKELWNPGKWLNACASTAKALFSPEPEDVQPWCARGCLLCTAWPPSPPTELLVRETDIPCPRGAGKGQNKPKSVPPVGAQPQWELADGHPAHGPQLSRPSSDDGHYVSCSGWCEKAVRLWHRNHLSACY